jgi:curli biogenesis system outer membrane secretion channel CsgG
MNRYILGALALLVAADPAAAQKRKVAVLRFNDASVQAAVAQMGGGNQDVGSGIADLLIQKLVEDGKYSVVERAALEKVGNEQNLSQGQLSDPDAAAKIGRLLNVDFIIIGTVNQFGAETHQTTVGGGTNLSIKGFGIGGVATSDSKALVEITARMIDVNNEEIVAAATGKGESSKSGGVSLQGTSDSKSGGGSLDMTGSDFSASLLGDATHKAVNSVGAQLGAKASSLPAHVSKVNAVVADVSGNTLILNAGSNAGVKVGDELVISRAVRTVKDPTTGAVLKTVTTKIGMAKVTEVDEGSATVTLTPGTNGPAKVGDMAVTPSP